MAQFQYKAIDPAGRVKRGTINATNKAQAKKALVRMRLRPLTLKATKAGNGGGDLDLEDRQYILGKFVYKDSSGNIQVELFSKQPTDKDLIVFTKQFATMLNSGVPLIQALGLLARQQQVRSFGVTLEQIRRDVENGATLSQAMANFPKTFDDLYVSMIRAGEASGNLDSILLKLVSYIERAAKIRSQVKSAMTYPAIVVVVAIIVVAALLVFVVPTFAAQYKENNQELPGLTQFVIDASDFFVEQWYVIFGALAVVVIGVTQYIKTERGRRWWDDLLLKLPGFGVLFKKIAVGRFCSTMSTMLTSGVNLLEALDICAASSGNKTIESFVRNVRARIEGGEKMSDPLSEGGLFPPMVVSMVAVGETTGALDEMLTKVNEFYEDEIDIAIRALMSLIEPVMIVGIGGIVGLVVIAMYLPVFDMGNLVGG